MFSKIKGRNFWFIIYLQVSIIKNVENRLVCTLSGINCTRLEPGLVMFTLCELKAIQRGIKEVSVRVTLQQKPFDNVTINIAVKRRGYEHQKPTFELTVDICRFLRSKHRNPIANIGFLLSGADKYSNLNQTCPIYNEIFVNKARIDESLIGVLPIPAGDYTTFTTWTADQVPSAQVNIRFKLYNP